jgi:hypothetical protein
MMLSLRLSALMEEKLKTKVIKEGLISMKGDIKVHNDNSDDVDLIEPIEEFTTGAVVLILGHSESVNTVVPRADPIIQSQLNGLKIYPLKFCFR